MSSTNPEVNHLPPPLRILIVDDIAHVRAELQSVLELAGRFVIVGQAANGKEALQRAEQLRPDVVLMDLEMPVLDGWEATRLLKARGLVERIAVLSIHADHKSIARAKEAGADAFVIKGSEIPILLRALTAPGPFYLGEAGSASGA